MVKMRKVLAVTMAAAMTMSMLAGCGDKKADSTEEQTVQCSDSETTEITEDVSSEANEADTDEADTDESSQVVDGDVLIDLNFDDNDTDGCATYFNGGQAELLNENGELCLDVTSTGKLDYANQIFYDGFALNQDCVYELSFDVHSTIERALQYRIQINGGDYHAYVMDEAMVGTDTQHVSTQFTMSEESDPAPRLCMNLGHFESKGDDSTPHKIYFDNIKLTVVDASKAQQVESIPEPKIVNVNQLGYKKNAQKLATITNESAKTFDVVDVATGKSVKTGELGDWHYDSGADLRYTIVDFSDVNAEGTYKITVDTGEESYEFQVKDGIYDDIYKASVLMLYDQRCGTALDSAAAGDFAHEACHTGQAIVYGSDVAKDVTGGWHDAGDYGRYVVPGAKAVQDLLLTYEDSAEAAKDDTIGIPESGNGVPDILDEARYELDWMLKMQDENSGGVYHKVTGEVFPETVLAVDETAQMILSPISTAATGDFAAVMAKASVIYRDIDKDFADTCLAAAQKAWKYLEEHEEDPGFTNVGDIVTGSYSDARMTDEYLWAAAELYIATGDESYNDYVKKTVKTNVKYGLGWADVGYYAIYDYCMNVKDCEAEKAILKEGADELVKNYGKCGFGSATGGEYVWGSNMAVANDGMLLLMASKVFGDDSYVDYAADQLNYLLGRNPVSYCYVTGYGSQTPENPHHRPSEVLGKAMPGMLIGGANGNLQDPYAKAVLADMAPEKCYVDNAQSYSCNEVTIYWNSPLVYLLAAMK